MNSLVDLTAQHLKDVLEKALEMKPSERVMVIFDTRAPLTKLLVDGYQKAVPSATYIDFDTTAPEEIKARVAACSPGDAVVLVQSANFRLNEFRFRIELFQRGLKTIEHMHLNRMSEDQFETYISALAYDPAYYRTRGRALKNILDTAQTVEVVCAGTALRYGGGMESTKLNVGDYTGMKNVGGTFPIGEVFTEPKDLTKVNGEAMVFAFADKDHMVRMVEPFKVTVTQGILTAPDAPREFQEILNLIRADEEVMVREFGLGLNKAFNKKALVNDITAFERQNGMHVSLGAKHTVYAKENVHRKKARYHIDVFVDIQAIVADGQSLYNNGDFTL